MNTKDFEKLQRKLKDHNIAAVARATGLHKNTIYRIMRGEAKNPSYCTVQTLLEYLRRDKNEPDQADILPKNGGPPDIGGADYGGQDATATSALGI
jgi:transcriptional regulator with XRE-family HTH domain